MKPSFFIPKDQKKYSVGENAEMRSNADGRIEMGTRTPEGVAEDDGLPITRENEEIDTIVRIYAPDFEQMKRWKLPRAEKVGGV